MGDWLLTIYYNHSSNQGKFFIPPSLQQVGLSYAHASNALHAIFALDLLHSRYIRDVDSWTLLYQKGLKYIADKGIHHLIMDLIIDEII